MKRARKNSWREVIGSTPDAFVDSFYSTRPDWITGSLSHHDARFLFRQTLEASPTVAVEIGTASGLSTAVICYALSFANQAGAVPSDFRVVSYDIDRRFYADRKRRVGDAAREMIPADLLAHITFRAPAIAADVRKHHGLNEVAFLFLDANHQHPWPTLDLLAVLDYLGSGAIVILHDINLPLRLPDTEAHWGVKYLFDDSNVDKATSREKLLPNVGRITIPDDKVAFRDQLLEILFAHPWEADVSEAVTTAALL
jgi:predicted O-methyltransferase YrrM